VILTRTAETGRPAELRDQRAAMRLLFRQHGDVARVSDPTPPRYLFCGCLTLMGTATRALDHPIDSVIGDEVKGETLRRCSLEFADSQSRLLLPAERSSLIH
jgi:hypothetical protein